MADADEVFDISTLGESAGKVTREEVGGPAGASTDLSFLGRAGTDPVGAAQEVPQLVRDNKLGADLLDEARRGSSPITDYPMEPGTSRAAKELPEMFTGKTEMNPRYEALEEKLRNPNLSFKDRVGLNMQLREMEGEETVRTPSGMGAGLGLKDKAIISAAAMTMFDPGEIAQMLLQVDPETGKRKWPQFSMQHAPDGTIIMNNSINGARSVINAPGMSRMDLMQGLGIAAAFTPAGRATAAMPSLAGRLAVGATTAGLTEAAIQQGQEMAGGQFDKSDVAISAGAGVLADLGRPLIGLGQRTGKFIGSYLPESWTQGLKGVIPEVKAQVLDFAKQAGEYLQSGRPARLMTEDAVPEAHSPWRKILLKMVERMPITGTGGARLAQREQRVEVLRHLADRFHLDPNTNYGATVINELNGAKGEVLQAARGQADEAVQAMAGNPEMKVNIRDFRFKVRDLLAQEEAYGEMANKGVIDLLNKARNAVWQGGKEQDFARGFGNISDWLQRLRMEASTGSPQSRALLTEAADALEADLRRTAREQGGEAGQRWLSATTQEARIVAEAESKSLRGLIESGAIDSQVIRRVLKNGSPEDIQILRGGLGEEGVNAARQMILRNALRVGGWRRTAANEAVISPKKVLGYLEKEPVEAQLRAFFPENELGGMMEYLRMTAQAEEIGKNVGMAASGGIGAIGASAVNLATLGVAGLLGHAYQSAPIRNLLLRLYHVKDDVRAKDAIMNELTPLLMAAGRQQMNEWNADDTQGSTYLSDEYVQSMSEEEGAPEAQPSYMDQLRNSLGFGASAEGEEGSGITDRLTEMFNEAEQAVE